MDPQNSIRDIVPCSLCRFSMAPLHCKICVLRLQCSDCAENSIRELTNDHEEQQSVRRRRFLFCSFCNEHDIRCRAPFVKHFEISHDLKMLNIKRDLRELENYILPKYQNLTASIPVQDIGLNNIFKKLTTTLNKQGENLHRKVDSVKRKSDLDEIHSNCLSILEKRKVEIEHNITDISLSIAYLKKLLESGDFIPTKNYKSRNSDFRKKLHPEVKLILPEFITEELDREQIYHQFTSLFELSFRTKETSGAESSPTGRPLMEEPLTITSLNIIKHRSSSGGSLIDVACVGDENIWIAGEDMWFHMMLYTLQGELLKSVQTMSGYKPVGIAVTKDGELVYADGDDRTVNIVKKNTQIQTVIILEGWTPANVCITSSGYLLVVMYSDDGEQSKVSRYNGSTELQSFQYDDEGQPLYSSESCLKYICENRNLDICVSDDETAAGTVVVVNQAGKLRFKYSGSSRTTKGSFRPFGITTDSQGRILVADFKNHCVHVLDQDGQFLCLIDNYDLFEPRGLCVDTRDNLIVAENKPCRVKKIQYCI
eukprot:XP_011429734.1 PREDICTED: uncharacterized protein LOC105329933 [Crassostrea gigas]